MNTESAAASICVLSDIAPLQVYPTRTRGIGRYTAKVLSALLEDGCADQAYVLLGNGHLPPPDPLPESSPVPWRLFYGDYALGEYQPSRWREALPAYTAYWQAQIDRWAPDVVHIHNPFEWQVPLHGHYSGPAVVMTVHDLIPLRMEEHYLRRAPEWQQRGYDHVCQLVRKADHIITGSQHAKGDIAALLGVAADRISVAAEGRSSSFASPPDDTVVAGLRQRHGLRGAFVLCTGGYDHRKNLDGVLRSYSRLPPGLRRENPLVIVCGLLPEEEEALRRKAADLHIGSDVVLTNHVSDTDLVALYHMATVQFFPSLYEGFGLPVLEAMTAGLPVVTSNVTSLPEVAGDAAVYVDPLDVESMASALLRVLQDPALRASLRARGLERAKLFDWVRAARVLREVYASLARGPSRRWRPTRRATRQRERPGLALVSPLPPQRSGVADYAAKLLAALRELSPVTAFVEPGQLPAARQHVVGPVEPVHMLPRMVSSGQIVATLYQVGNSLVHGFQLPYLISVPGVVELHDAVIHGLVHASATSQGGMSAYRHELSYAHGETGRRYVDDVIAGREPAATHELAANRRIVNAAAGLIVHSRWAADSVRQHGTHVPVEVIPLAIDPDGDTPRSGRERVRNELGIGDGQFVCAVFGRLAPPKRIAPILRVVARVRREVPAVRLLLVGPVSAPRNDLDIPRLVEELAIGDIVHMTEFVDSDVFRDCMAATDVALNLRHPHVGETSATLVQLLSAGVPVITSNVGAFAELPDDCCWKVDVDASEEDLLQAYLLRLARNVALRRQMGDNAARYARDQFPTCEMAAERCLAFIEQAMRSQSALMPRLAARPRPRRWWPWGTGSDS